MVYAGNLGKAQGVDVIVEAARSLSEYKNIQFVIWGNGSEEERLKDSAKELDIFSIFPLQTQERVSEVYKFRRHICYIMSIRNRREWYAK